jgi:hypothetical protein
MSVNARKFSKISAQILTWTRFRFSTLVRLSFAKRISAFVRIVVSRPIFL